MPNLPELPADRVQRALIWHRFASLLDDDDRAILMAALVTVDAADRDQHPRELAIAWANAGSWPTEVEWAAERARTLRAGRNARRRYAGIRLEIPIRRLQG